MRVLLISHTCQSRTEGQPKPEALGRMGDIDLCVLTPDRWKHYGKWREPQRPEDAPFRYEIGRVALPWVGPAQCFLHHYPGLTRLIREFQPDVIDLWEEPWGLVSAHACWVRDRFFPQIKIVTETEQNINKSLPPPFENFRSYVLRRADYAVGRNAESIDILKKKGYAGPAEVVPNAVDAELFHPMDRAACREALGLSGFVAGYVGRMVEEKGLMDLLESLPHCEPEVNLLFVGSGPFQAALEEKAQAQGWGGRVRFLPARPLTELPQIMNALDAFVLPSRTTASWKEQFGRVIIEAQACRTPVVGSDSGAIPEVIAEAGLVFPERDPAALGAALERLRGNPGMAQAMGLRGREQVEAQFTWQRVAERMQAIYRRVLSEK